jgi:hypothetical protein
MSILVFVVFLNFFNHTIVAWSDYPFFKKWYDEDSYQKIALDLFTMMLIFAIEMSFQLAFPFLPQPTQYKQNYWLVLNRFHLISM